MSQPFLCQKLTANLFSVIRILNTFSWVPTGRGLAVAISVEFCKPHCPSGFRGTHVPMKQLPSTSLFSGRSLVMIKWHRGYWMWMRTEMTNLAIAGFMLSHGYMFSAWFLLPQRFPLVGDLVVNPSLVTSATTTFWEGSWPMKSTFWAQPA